MAKISMATFVGRLLGYSTALVVLSVAASSSAYSWGQLRSPVDWKPGQCGAVRVPGNVEAWEVITINGVTTESAHKWGPDAVNLLATKGMPIQVRDDGEAEGCAKYSNVWVSLIFNEGRQASVFHQYVGNWFYQGGGWGGDPPDIYMRKQAFCSGQNVYQAYKGTGGGGPGYSWQWIIYANYFRDFTGDD